MIIINKKGRARFKYFPGATSSGLLFYIEPKFAEDRFDMAIIIHLGISDLLSKTTGTECLLQKYPEDSSQMQNACVEIDYICYI